MKKNLIWDNDIGNAIDAVKEEWLETERGELSDDEALTEAYQWIENSLGDEVMNLDIEAKGALIAIGTIERWNGGFSAYKLLETKNIGKAIETIVGSCFTGDNSFECYEEDGKLIFTQLGHDNPVNPSIIEIRELTCDFYVLEDDKQDILLANSKPCGHYAAEVYGWEVR